jgi:hypothetical protein
VRIAQQCAPQNVKRAAELKAKACGHRGVTRVGVARVTGLVALQKNFGNLAVSKPANGTDIAEAGNLNVEALGSAPVRKALATIADCGPLV